MTSRLKQFLPNASLVLGSLITLTILVEVGLRLAGFSHASYFRPDDRLGLRLRENVRGHYRAEGSAEVYVNAAGFRDRERALIKPADVFRIAVLGDSYIEALQVEQDETFTSQLEQRLNSCGAFGRRRVEVLNFGVSSYGTAQQLLNFRYHVRRYAPDLVIAAVFTGNDIRNNSRDLEPDKVRPFFVVDGAVLIEDRSFAQSPEYLRRTNTLRAALDGLRMLRVVQAVYFFKDRVQFPTATRAPPSAAAFEAGLDDAVFGEPRASAWRDAWVVTERLVDQLNREVSDAGARLLIVTLSSGIQVHPDPQVRKRFEAAGEKRDLFYPDRRIEAIGAGLGVQTITLAPELQRFAERDKTFFHGFANTRMGSGHWNAAGHRAAADLVAARLCQRDPARVVS